MSNLTLWDPFNEMMSLRDAMSRLFEESVVRPSPTTETRGFSFPVDLYETEKDYVLTATLPGIKPENLNINVRGDFLTISAETRFETTEPTETKTKDKERNYVYREIRHGSYTRQIALPGLVQVDKAVAQFENGVLKLTLPKAEETRTRQIKVQVTDGKGETKEWGAH